MIRMIAVLLSFGVAFILIPYYVLPRPSSARSVLDVVTVNFVRWLAIVMVGVQLLAALRMFEMLAIMAALLVGLYFSRLKPSGYTLSVLKEKVWDGILWMLAILDRFELKVRVGEERLDPPKLRLVPPPPSDIPKRSWKRIALLAAVPVGVIGISFWLRAGYAMGNLSLSPPDMYHHMAWAKELSANRLFVDGIYPHGIPVLLAFTNKFNGFVSMLDVARFMGPIVGTMLVYGIFYTLYRLTNNFGAATFGAGVFGLLGTRPEWHAPWFRQTAALPQELALAIALLALPAAVAAVVHRDKDHLWTLAAACVAIGLTHPVPLPLFVLLACAGATGAALLGGGWRYVMYVYGVTIGGAAAAMSYMPIARLVGLEFFEPIRNFTPFAGSQESSEFIPLSVGATGFHGFAKIAVPAVIVGGVISLTLLVVHKGRMKAGRMFGLTTMCAVIVVLYNIRGLGLDPYYADRLAQAVGPCLALVVGLAFAAATVMIPKERLLSAGLLLGLSVFGLMTFGRTFPASAGTHAPVSFESTIATTERIAHDYERYTYTVVGTPQQRQVVLSDGWFIESWVFARDVTLRSARDVGYQMVSRKGVSPGAAEVGGLIGIPTQDVFLFVEKQPFEGPRLGADGPTKEYYLDPVKRGRIMARIYEWAEIYMRYHSDMEVYFEDDDLKVYRITRAPDVKGSLDSYEFKDYTWLPGKLFNAGPTRPDEVVLPPWRSQAAKR